jgi:hypothetical protein
MYEAEIKTTGNANPTNVVIHGTALTLDDVYQTGVPMLGTSIGAHDNAESCGSMGFFVKVTVGDEAQQLCAVTCHHVVAPGTFSGRATPNSVAKNAN